MLAKTETVAAVAGASQLTMDATASDAVPINDTAAASAYEDEHALTILEGFRRYPKAVLWAIAMSMTIVMEGYDTILMGSLMAYPPFVEKYGTYHPELQRSVISGPWQVGLTIMSNCSGVLGLVMYGFVTERFGHRIVTMVGLTFLAGFIFIPFFSPSIHTLLVGQFFMGITWGMFSIMGAAYSSEICPLPLRGYLTSYVNMCWAIGQFISAGILQGLVNNRTEWAYRIPFAVEWVWPIPLFLLALFAPDSPWWLVRKGRLNDAKQSLRRLTSGLTDDEIDQKLSMMVHTNKLEQKIQEHVSHLDCFRGTNLRRTEIACMILSTQTLVGASLAYNATFFFVQAGLSPSDSYKLGFGNTGIAFAATCFSWLFMTYFGRRPMMITGLSLLTLILFLIGILSYASDHDAAKWGQATLDLIWIAIFSALVGPQSYTIASEVSSTRLRSQTLSIAGIVYNCFNIVDNTVEPYLINPTEANLKGKTAFVWFGIGVLMTLWAVFRLPETQGRTYGDLDILFERRIPAWKFASEKVDIMMESEMRFDAQESTDVHNEGDLRMGGKSSSDGEKLS